MIRGLSKSPAIFSLIKIEEAEARIKGLVALDDAANEVAADAEAVVVRDLFDARCNQIK